MKQEEEKSTTEETFTCTGYSTGYFTKHSKVHRMELCINEQERESNAAQPMISTLSYHLPKLDRIK